MSKKLQALYAQRKDAIRSHMKRYDLKSDNERYAEFLFCTITPQSNAHKCWEAIEIILKERPKTQEQFATILKGRARFHNMKAARLINSERNWKVVKTMISDSKDVLELRNSIENFVNGYGLKEASHFLRNIGLSNSKVAILDRHILRSLQEHGAIKDIRIKGKKGYLELEKQALAFSDKVKIPMDELDMLFWHNIHGEFFK